VNPRHDPEHTITLGETAERVAALDGITREESDAFGLRSQERAAKAVDNGAFDAEIVPGRDDEGREQVTVTRDETVRPHQPGEARRAQARVHAGRRRHRRHAAARCPTARRRSSSRPRRPCATSG
jgi:acetyl-CoA acetyltransferase